MRIKGGCTVKRERLAQFLCAATTGLLSNPDINIDCTTGEFLDRAQIIALKLYDRYDDILSNLDIDEEEKEDH